MVFPSLALGDYILALLDVLFALQKASDIARRRC
jgi:hypothetical protein